jgi:hypothetical protein
MIDFIKKRILFISTYDVAYGDFMTNSLITNYICDYFENRVLIHYLISDTTNERISWFIENQNISDRTFLQQLNTKFCIEKFKNYPKNYYDYIIIDHCYNELDDVLNHFEPEQFLSVHKYPDYDKYPTHDKIKYLYKYLNIKKENPQNYFFGYNFDRLNFKINELIGDSKYIILFPFSTRSLASINLDGILRINEFAKSKNCKLILAGVDINVYSFNNGMSENLNIIKNNQLLDDNIINLMGISTNKIIYLANKAEYVFYGPTGTAILPILGLVKNKNNYIITGGNTDVMIDILKTFPDSIASTKKIRPACPFFPCELHKFNVNDLPQKVKECNDKKQASCLNQEIDIKI